MNNIKKYKKVSHAVPKVSKAWHIYGQGMENFGDEKLADYKLEWITDMKRSNYVVEMKFEKGMGYNEILMIAAKREEKALALYNELENKVEDEKGKKLFKVLAQEEAKHKLSLETLYDDYMAKMGD